MAHGVTKNLPAAALTEIAIDFTRPVYLVKLLFPAGARYVSTNIQIAFEGNLYIEGQVSVGTFQWTADGVQTGFISLSNEASAASALVLSATTNDVEIEIYQTYLIAGGEGGNTPPVLYVKGVMDGARLSPTEARITVVSTTARAAFLPNRYHTASEGFNWLPIDGEVITWGADVFTLQSRP
jgi:hypothetical protein